ncbi:MAG TPA: MFS transporter, partial [Planctomycetota bacterium]|nr:MFS transporter [Planctomycetota bacterium]
MPALARASEPPAKPRRIDRRRGLTPTERRRALEVSTLEGMFATAHSALSGNGIGGNAFTSAYALLLGASNAWLGVLSALPNLATAGQSIAAYALQRVRSRRRFVVGSCLFARNLVFLMPLLPYVLPRDAARAAFVALFGIAAFGYQFAGNGWTSWMSDTVPSGLRGRYFSRRSNLCNLVGLVAGIAGAVALDAYAGPSFLASPNSIARRTFGFVFVFGASAALGGISTWLLTTQPEPARAGEEPPIEAAPGTPSGAGEPGEVPLREFLATPFRHPEFRKVLAFFSCFFFANGLGNPFFNPYILEDLHRSMSFVTVLTFATGIAGLLTLPLWGRALDRFGAKPLLAICAIAASFHPLYYIIATPRFVAPIWADAISSGIVWGGWNLAILDIQLTIAPEGRGREMYFAAYAGATGLALATGSILSGAIADMI